MSSRICLKLELKEDVLPQDVLFSVSNTIQITCNKDICLSSCEDMLNWIPFQRRIVIGLVISI